MVRALAILFLLLFLGVVGAAGAGVWVLAEFGRGLPDYAQLADYEPPLMSRVHAGDGALMEEYAREHRLFVPIDAMPKRVIQAFIAAEDKNFYDHPGLDLQGIVRAVVVNLQNYAQGRRLVGASTITQQVAKNFLLSNEVSFERKIKEAILAIRIERAISKDRILELYLNEIYLGFGSFGVAAASLNYFDKPLDELTLAEAAYLAALPKAPNNYHPIKKTDRAIARRNYVLTRMTEDRYVTTEESHFAMQEELRVANRQSTQFYRAGFFAEEVRRELLDIYGENGLYEGGLSVRTSLDPDLQSLARQVLRSGLSAYDRRHGYRGVLGTVDPTHPLEDQLKADWLKLDDAPWKTAVVADVSDEQASLIFPGQRDWPEPHTGVLLFSGSNWARPILETKEDGSSVLGSRPKTLREVVKPGDVILVNAAINADGEEIDGKYDLRQIPKINGGLVAMDPHTGRVLAMMGGFSDEMSEFNRATQAKRQPGSAFKPFVYAAALEKGFTPSSLVLDGPFVIDQGPGLGKWKPANYSDKFYGPSTLRLGIEKSRNLMTVRLAQFIGMDSVREIAKRFGIVDDLPDQLSMALGAGETTLLRLTTAYAMLVNGGKQVSPTLIDRVQDRRGKTIYKNDDRPCNDCQVLRWNRQPIPDVPDTRNQIIDSGNAFQLVSMLEGVVERGTGVRIKTVGKPLAGKTGTTNQERDTWFIGFSPDLAVGVFVGFDNPLPLGKRETGSSVSAPIFRDFMTGALEDKASIPFRIPSGINLVRINSKTGERARPGDRSVILEAFKPGTEPTNDGRNNVLDGSEPISGVSSDPFNSTTSGTGGLY